MNKLAFSAAAALAVGAASAQATVLLPTQDFSFTGDLTANGWTTLNTTIAPIASDGNVATVSHGGGVNGQDIFLDGFSSTPLGADTTYLGVDFTLQSAGSVTSNFRFVELRDVSAAGAAARTYITPAQASGDFSLATSTDANTPTGFLGVDLDFDTTYRLIISYNGTSGQSGIEVVGFGSGEQFSTAGTTGIVIEQAELRQENSGVGTHDVLVDNLIVATTSVEAVPEPGTLAMFIVGATALFMRRRRS